MTEERPRYWRAADPKPAYDVIIVGAGGHGLATAYYLATNHGITDVCVVEKGWLGGGNTARNTTIIRSNYLWDESAALYEHSLKLWETLEETLDFPMQFSQRGVHQRLSARHREDPVADRSRIGDDPTQQVDIQPFRDRRPGVGIAVQALQIAAPAGMHLQGGIFSRRAVHERPSRAG